MLQIIVKFRDIYFLEGSFFFRKIIEFEVTL